MAPRKPKSPEPTRSEQWHVHPSADGQYRVWNPALGLYTGPYTTREAAWAALSEQRSRATRAADESQSLHAVLEAGGKQTSLFGGAPTSKGRQGALFNPSRRRNATRGAGSRRVGGMHLHPIVRRYGTGAVLSLKLVPAHGAGRPRHVRVIVKRSTLHLRNGRALGPMLKRLGLKVAGYKLVKAAPLRKVKATRKSPVRRRKAARRSRKSSVRRRKGARRVKARKNPARKRAPRYVRVRHCR